jgi:hypothetical protein|eukprot:COSAG03_NODE_1292_length_4391_cov_1.278425_5_plen_78_part_00
MPALPVIASCYKDESSRAILEREFGRTELLVDYLDVAETETTHAAADCLGECCISVVAMGLCLANGYTHGQAQYTRC